MKVSTRRQVRSTLSSIDSLIPVPWSMTALIDRLAQHRERPIILVPWDFSSMSNPDISGLWLPSERGDYIFYAQAATPFQREQIIGHELGHMLLDHTPKLTDAPDELLQALVPSLSHELARRFLTRSGYKAADEAAAEEFGTRLIQRGATKRPRGNGGSELDRLTDAL
jgi:hypothetical protein